MKMCYESQEKKWSRKVDRELKDAKKWARKELKLLLLGAGESGKSTFMKQMRIIHDGGFATKELESQRKYVFHNTIVCMQRILLEMSTFGIELECAQNKAYAERLLTLEVTYENVGSLFPAAHLPEEFVNAVATLWTDMGVRACYERRTEYQLSDSAEYFFTNVTRFGEPNYMPTNQDMVRIRLPTTGITEHSFRIKKIWLRIVDVGGQCSERRKWIHCFESVRSIVFLTALNEYDMHFDPQHQYRQHQKGKQHGGSSGEHNRMQESLALFKVISRTDVLANASFILFLNKTDLFKEKIAHSPLQRFFPEYNGPVDSAEAAGDFIRELFVNNAFCQTNGHNDMIHTGMNGTPRPSWTPPQTETHRQKSIYTHFTCATDTENIKFVFDSVKHQILQDNINIIFPHTVQ